MTTNHQKKLLLQLKNDIKSSLYNTLATMTRDEHKELSWFCSEEKKMLEAKQAA